MQNEEEKSPTDIWIGQQGQSLKNVALHYLYNQSSGNMKNNMAS